MRRKRPRGATGEIKFYKPAGLNSIETDEKRMRVSLGKFGLRQKSNKNLDAAHRASN
jgi:hypothetical protein